MEQFLAARETVSKRFRFYFILRVLRSMRLSSL